MLDLANAVYVWQRFLGGRPESSPDLPEDLSKGSHREWQTRTKKRHDVVLRIPRTLVYPAIAPEPLAQIECAVTVITNARCKVGIFQYPFPSGAHVAGGH